MTELIAARDEDFDWMAGAGPGRGGLRLPPGGVDEAETLAVVRAIHRAGQAAGRPGAWLIVDNGEVVGLCGAARPAEPGEQEAGEIEIGYGVAPERRRLGHATRAVAALAAMGRRGAGLGDPAPRALTAVTAAGNGASAAVLERNGFRRAGVETREEEGLVILWRLEMDEGRRATPEGLTAASSPSL